RERTEPQQLILRTRVANVHGESISPPDRRTLCFDAPSRWPIWHTRLALQGYHRGRDSLREDWLTLQRLHPLWLHLAAPRTDVGGDHVFHSLRRLHAAGQPDAHRHRRHRCRLYRVSPPRTV